MKKIFVILISTAVMTCLISQSESSALTYEWNQTSAWSIALPSYDDVDMSSSVNSSGTLEVSSYIPDPQNTNTWQVTISNFLFSLTDVTGDVYPWNTENVATTYYTAVDPWPGKILLDIHLNNNNQVGFADASDWQHDIYTTVGDPGFPYYMDDDIGVFNFAGNWTEKTATVPEPNTLFLLASGLIVVGIMRRYIITTAETGKS